MAATHPARPPGGPISFRIARQGERTPRRPMSGPSREEIFSLTRTTFSSSPPTVESIKLSAAARGQRGKNKNADGQHRFPSAGFCPFCRDAQLGRRRGLCMTTLPADDVAYNAARPLFVVVVGTMSGNVSNPALDFCRRCSRRRRRRGLSLWRARDGA